MSTSSTSALSHLKFRHLMLIALLAEQGTLHKAARALSVSQPAVTAMLNDLEQVLGIRLFERTHRGVRPTPNGERVIDGVTTLLNEFHAFTERVQRIGDGRERMLRMGIVPQVFATHLPATLEGFRAQGGCAVRIQEGTARQLLGLLWDGLLDGVIGRLPSTGVPQEMDAASLRLENFYTERIGVVMGAGREGRPPPSDVEGLARQDWVLQRRDSSVRLALNEAFLQHGLQPPEPAVETTNYLQSLQLVAHTGYCTVAPLGPARLMQATGAVRVLEIDLGLPAMPVTFITRVASEGNRELRLFRESFRGVVQGAGVGRSGRMSGVATEPLKPGRLAG